MAVIRSVRGDKWYYRRTPPVFCNCWRPIYEWMRPGRQIAIIVGGSMAAIGILFLLIAFIVCVMGRCHGGVVSLWPLGIIFVWFGLMFFHCGWASSLLDDDDFYRPADPFEKPEPDKEVPISKQNILPPEKAPVENPSASGGYWQFAERPAWQAVSSRYPTYYNAMKLNP